LLAHRPTFWLLLVAVVVAVHLAAVAAQGVIAQAQEPLAVVRLRNQNLD
jgi:hypothetical protein